MIKIYKSISIIVPTYNEIDNIDALISRITSSFKNTKIKFEIIFIDDHSTDKTMLKIKKYASRKNIFGYTKLGKKGKAYSILEGIKKARYETIAMIDADLQYPPESLPLMMKELKSADIIVANRKEYKVSNSRKILSRSFKEIFGNRLFGLKNDIQSGLKVFTKEVADSIDFMPRSGWTFDLEFLHRANQAGFVIKDFDITFAKREYGSSKMGVVKQTYEIGVNALKMKFKKIHPVSIQPNNKSSMVGAGVGYKKGRYITHTTIPSHLSALKTFTPSQKMVIFTILGIILGGFYLNAFTTLKILIATLTTIYFTDVMFNLFLIGKSLNSPEEITSSLKELNAIDENELPIYTILCPLYKEAMIIPQFIKAIEKLSWPKEKLNVILLLEEDDKETIEIAKKMNLPKYVTTLVVPHSFPKTKPKACNYGLNFAKGEYLVIFDAEDIPEPMQLKKAYLGFKKSAANVICLQAKLNYYNPHQNLLTRFFTAEYSLWFDITLPGLQAVDTALPLGGTSNHFKTENLREVQGWDPFNVTEDADLGIRLFKKGYKTAMIDSITLEEANSNVRNWFRQRSRWIKGYMQTYLVHNRRTAKSEVKYQKLHSLFFQLTIGGKIAFVLINPILWVATIAYFTLYAYVGPTIEALYPSGVFYMAVISLVLGNFLFLYYYMIGLAKRKQWNLIKFVYFIPIYWFMISISAFMALYQLIFKPHYWEKTVHGLHLAKSKKAVVAEAIIETEEKEAGFTFTPTFRNRAYNSINSRRVFIGGAILVMTTVLANFLNFLFNAYLGRTLDFDDFALIGLIGAFLSASSILFSAFSTTTNYRTGYLIGKYDESVGILFWKHIRKRAFMFSVIIAAIWISLTPFLMNYFKSENPYPFFLFGLVILIGLMSAANRGLLYSKLMFGWVAVINLLDPVIKLLLVISLVYFGMEAWSFTAVPVGAIGMFGLATLIIAFRVKAQSVKKIKPNALKFPIKFFIAAFISGFAAVALLSFDILLANHYLSPSEAGEYTLISLIGKMVFFLGSLTSPFITPLISRDEGAGKSSTRKLNFILGLTAIFSLVGFIAFGVLSRFTIPFLYGEKSLSIIEYLPAFTLGMAFFTISSVLINYYLVKKNFTFVITPIILVGAQLILISRFHANIGQIVLIMSSIWLVHLMITFALHLGHRYVVVIENNFKNFIELFAPLQTSKKSKNILIFNWRDTRHKWAGGAEVYLQEISKGLAKEDINVIIFCGNDGTKSDNEIVDGIQIFRRGGFYTVYFWAMIYYIFKFRGKFDFIIDSENGIPFFTPLFSRVPKILLIHHVHQEVFRKSLKWPLSTIALFLEAKLMPFVYRKVQVVTVSPSSKKEILKHKLTNKEPLIIYSGINKHVYKPGKKSTIPSVLYLGRIQYYKSLHVFLVAAKQILSNNPDVEFTIAGDGEEKKHLIHFAQKLGINHNINFLGKVDEKTKISLLQKAWVFVNPSLMEGWGITTIEAAACGTPTVASDVPGLRDSIKNNQTGILVRYGKYNGFAKEVNSLLKNKMMRTKLSKNAVDWAQTFTWENSTLQIIGLINSEINRKNLNKSKIGRFKFSRINFTNLF